MNEIGFDYIRPYWSSRDFILAVPTANAGSFPLLGDVGHVDNHFALAPRLNYKYDVSDVFALTSSLNFILPVHPSWDLFTTLRGSILVGDNNKDSSLSVNLQGQPGVSTSITQSKTEFVPVGEIEIGTAWTHAFGDVSRPEIPPALFTVRMGLTGQVWGNIGPLSAGSPQGYQTSNLFLVGAHVMVGLTR
jgi:hypothetical protein